VALPPEVHALIAWQGEDTIISEFFTTIPAFVMQALNHLRNAIEVTVEPVIHAVRPCQCKYAFSFFFFAILPAKQNIR
jgi:hypothetical protein